MKFMLLLFLVSTLFYSCNSSNVGPSNQTPKTESSPAPEAQEEPIIIEGAVSSILNFLVSPVLAEESKCSSSCSGTRCVSLFLIQDGSRGELLCKTDLIIVNSAESYKFQLNSEGFNKDTKYIFEIEVDMSDGSKRRSMTNFFKESKKNAVDLTPTSTILTPIILKELEDKEIDVKEHLSKRSEHVNDLLIKLGIGSNIAEGDRAKEILKRSYSQLQTFLENNAETLGQYLEKKEEGVSDPEFLDDLNSISDLKESFEAKDDFDQDGHTKDLDCNDKDASIYKISVLYPDRDFDNIADKGTAPQSICVGDATPDRFTKNTNGPEYCSETRLANYPFANSGEAGIDGYTYKTAFTICSLAQLKALSTHKDYWGSRLKFRLMKDIDYANGVHERIGENTLPFKGQFDGNFKTVKNFKIVSLHSNVSASTRPYFSLGFFGVAEGAFIENMKLEVFAISGAENIGVLAGVLNNSIVRNIIITKGNNSTLAPISGKKFVGGLAGSIEKSQVSNVSISDLELIDSCVNSQGFTQAAASVGLVTGEIRGTSYLDGVLVKNSVMSENCVNGNGSFGLFAASEYRVPEIEIENHISNVAFLSLNLKTGASPLVKSSLYRMFNRALFYDVQMYSGILWNSYFKSFQSGFSPSYSMGNVNNVVNVKTFIKENSELAKTDLTSFPDATFVSTNMFFDSRIWTFTTFNLELDFNKGLKSY